MIAGKSAVRGWGGASASFELATRGDLQNSIKSSRHLRALSGTDEYRSADLWSVESDGFARSGEAKS